MPNQQFTLIVEGADLRSRPVVDALFEAGCDDATIGSIDDTHHIAFDREAPSLGEAILSAVRDVENEVVFRRFLCSPTADASGGPATPSEAATRPTRRPGRPSRGRRRRS